MRLTPMDIENHRFSHRLRGYDAGEVDDFIRIVGEDYESLLKENEALRETVRNLESRVAELAGQELRLRQTMVTAQTLTDDLKRTAIREAEMRVAEAEVRAEKILDAAQRRAARLEEEVREIRRVRTRVGAAVRATLESHGRILDGLMAEAAEADAAELAGARRTAAGGTDAREETPEPSPAAAPAEDAPAEPLAAWTAVPVGAAMAADPGAPAEDAPAPAPPTSALADWAAAQAALAAAAPAGAPDGSEEHDRPAGAAAACA